MDNLQTPYERGNKRGYRLLEVTPKETVAHFMGMDNVRDAKSPVAELAAFRVVDGLRAWNG